MTVAVPAVPAALAAKGLLKIFYRRAMQKQTQQIHDAKLSSEQAGITNDTDWNAIQPLIQKVMDAQQAAGGGMGGMGRMFGGRGGRGEAWVAVAVAAWAVRAALASKPIRLPTRCSRPLTRCAHGSNQSPADKISGCSKKRNRPRWLKPRADLRQCSRSNRKHRRR